jgi:sortase A
MSARLRPRIFLTPRRPRIVYGPHLLKMIGARSRRARYLLWSLIALGAALLVAGFWIPVKAELAQQLLNRAWAASKDGNLSARPWPWADTWPVARLTLPKHDRPLTVLAGASGRNLAFGPALMDGSALPGEPGVAVIAGHRDTHFRDLGELLIGDHFAIELPDGASYSYEVATIDVVDANRSMLRLDAEESVVALVTCYPFESVLAGGSLRYVVIAYPVR